MPHRSMRAGTSLATIVVCLACLYTVASASSYFPENVKLPYVNREINTSHDPDDANYAELQGLTGHPARFLPVNYTTARFYQCPWAFVPSCLFGTRLRASSAAKSHRASSICMNAAPKLGRRSLLGLGVGLGLGLLQGAPAAAANGGPSLRDLQLEQERVQAEKAAARAAAPKRPTELRNEESCYMWNGKKECFSCTKSCEAWKSVSPDLDCNKYCTVEYGAPKPTDEESISFRQFVDSVAAGQVQRVDFYGAAGDKAYATYKQGGEKIRIGEGFPIEIGNEPSSPLQVVRLLNQKEVPFKFHFLDNARYSKMGS